ncbi:MAG TPA: protein kinase, partial [Ktedonobacteraceae bacterium]
MLTDFGLVKIIAEGQTPRLRLTGAGAPVGTPDYMSPEQVVGNMVDGRSDLYSLGVILYQMLTGTTPFQGETPMQIAAQQWQSPPPSPRLMRPDLPVAAEQALLRAMAKRPEDRFASGYEFAEAFRVSLYTAGVVPENAPSKTPSMGTSTSARLFAPRGLFDPVWQQGATGTMPTALSANALSGAKPTGVLPAAQAEPARSTGLLSRTGMFPTVAGTGHLPAASNNNAPPARATGVLPAYTGAQPAMTPAGLGTIPMPGRTEPSPILLGGTGKQPRAGMNLAPTPMGLMQASPVLNTSGSLMVPKTEQGEGSTIKLTGPVKVVQVPVAGQPGRYVTGLLPVVPQTQEAEETVEKGKRGRKKTVLAIVLAALVLLVISGTGASFWYVHVHQGQTVNKTGTVISATPNVIATATAHVQATVEANQILSDSLSQNIHNLPTGKNEFFSGGAYHIVNTEGNAVAVVLPQQNFTVPNAYTLTMWEVKGDDTSNNNSFGMIIRFSQQNKGGKMERSGTVTTFYSFEVLN